MASNKVELYNEIVVLNDKGEVDMKCGKHKDLPLQKVKRMCDVLEVVADGCKSCKDVYGDVGMILNIESYESVSVVFDGDRQGGFYVETADKCIAAEQIGKELRCTVRRKDADDKGIVDKPIKVRKD